MWLEIIIGIFVLMFIMYKFYVRNYDYWKVRNIPYIESTFPFGSSKKFIMATEFNGKIFSDWYFKYKESKFVGFTIVRIPCLLLNDTELIKQVMTRDFHNFTDRGEPVQGILQQHLFNLRGEKWRILRAKLTPTFTSGKMRLMFYLIKQCGDRLNKSLEPYAARNEVIDMKDFLSRFGMDVIGTCAFGLEIDSLNQPDNEFRTKTVDIFKNSFRVLLWNLLNFIVKESTTTLGFNMFPKETEDFFVNMVKDVVDYRKKNNVVRNDFLDLLIEIQRKGHLDDEDVGMGSENTEKKSYSKIQQKGDIDLTDELMAAQCFVFFVAGFETSSSTVSFCLHELAVNNDIQVKLRNEIDRVLEKHDGKITYDSLKEMTYMDKVVNETLRKYSPVPLLTRECTNECLLDDKLKLEKGTLLIVPVFGLHYDPEFFPDPEKFDPERFSEEAKQTRPHYSYMPFGEGPRICIGMRFGWLQVKTGLTTILSKYEVSRAPQTQHPLKFSSQSIVTAVDEGIILKISKRS